jgi:hypothetical protein
MRETLLGTWTLAPAGYELDPRVQDKMTKAMLSDFRVLNPCIAELKSGVIESRIAAHSSGLVLSAWLKELPQLELDLCLKSGRSVMDLYSTEAERLLKSIKACRELVAVAVNPHVTSSEIRDLSSTNPLLVHLRRRARAKQSRTPVINDIGLQSALTSFPLGLVRRIKAKVVALTPKKCSLQDMQILNPVENDSTLVFPRSLLMTRPELHRNRAVVMELLHSMESGQATSMDVVVLLDWTNGQPQKLELRNLVPRQ